MEKIKIQNLSFAYAVNQKDAISSISTEVEEGDFVLLFGKSGSGKSTLLKMLKNEIRPHGTFKGNVWIDGIEINDVDTSFKIGFVMQNVENQLVCDKVWHELAFGLENQNVSQEEMRIRVAEVASFFNLQEIFMQDISTLSGGQKEIVVLASVMMMNPSILILDEPFSKLDITVREELLKYLKKIHEELGTTIVIAEHQLNDLIGMANKMIVMEDGKICYQGKKEDVIRALLIDHRYDDYLPNVIKLPKIWKDTKLLYDVGEARNYLKEKGYEYKEEMKQVTQTKKKKKDKRAYAISAKEIWFRYDKEEKDVLKGVNLSIMPGEIYALLAGNGSGKTTLLSVLCGILKPYAGKVIINKEKALLVQNPKVLFCQNTVKEELEEVSRDLKKIEEMVNLLELKNVLESHPFDLSGGEEERLGLAKVLLLDKPLILLDEPTKGLDGGFKKTLAKLLKKLKEEGKTILLVTHDMEFAAEVATRSGMLFNGEILAENVAKEFFLKNQFYTTDMVRMTRNLIPGVTTLKELCEKIKK